MPTYNAQVPLNITVLFCIILCKIINTYCTIILKIKEKHVWQSKAECGWTWSRRRRQQARDNDAGIPGSTWTESRWDLGGLTPFMSTSSKQTCSGMVLTHETCAKRVHGTLSKLEKLPLTRRKYLSTLPLRPERWIVTIPSSDQWLATIGNH